MRNGLSCSDAGRLGALETAKTAEVRKLKRRADYENNPKLCRFCKLPISYDKKVNDFCNHNCSAKFYNAEKGYSKDEVLENCLYCNNPITDKGQHKYCSQKCMGLFHWSKIKENLLLSGNDSSCANRVGKKYLIEINTGKCQICGLSEWNGKQMPLVLDHIDGNAYNNLLTNLRVICHNCDAQTPTFTGRNKGKGRVNRAKRYIEERDIFRRLNADIV